MKSLKIVMALAAGLIVAGCDMNTAPSGFVEVTVDQVQAQLESNNIPKLILDVRSEGEYASGHVPTAKNISVDTLASRLNEVPKDVDVYVYCESGKRSTRAAEMLAEAGYDKVHNMRASMRGWRAANYPIEK